jgi:hypothetical protein
MNSAAGTQGLNAPCPCVLRKIFRVCWNRYRFGQLEQAERGAPVVNISGLGKRVQRQPGGFTFALECYLADFILTVRRTLSADELAFFETAYLSGVDWARAHGPLNMDRSRFIHACYRLEATLGKALRETQPFRLISIGRIFLTARPWKPDGSIPSHQAGPVSAAGPAAGPAPATEARRVMPFSLGWSTGWQPLFQKRLARGCHGTMETKPSEGAFSCCNNGRL